MQVRHWIAGILLIIVQAAFALTDDDIYQAAVPVASQMDQDRMEAIPEALSRVFIKVSGDSHVLETDAVKQALAKSVTWIEQYSYVLPSIQKKNYRYLLKVRFDAEEVDRVLDNAGIRVWELNRPVVIGWVEQETSAHTAEIIDSATPGRIQILLKENAERRGIPFVLPMMDVTDMKWVTANDVAVMAIPALTTASQRYASDAILMIHIQQDTQGHRLQAKLVMGNDQWMWNVTALHVSKAIAELFDHIADTLAGRYRRG